MPDDTRLPLTPSQTVGPFFHDALVRPADEIIALPGARGRAVVLTGFVRDGDGEEVEDALVELWQPDHAGVFRHRADPRHASADPAMRGWGRSATPTGRGYRFVTVKPGPLPAPGGGLQAPFVSLTVFSRGLLRHLHTRLYFADDGAALAADPVWAALDPARRSTLLAQATPDGYRLDIVLQGEHETLFFTA